MSKLTEISTFNSSPDHVASGERSGRRDAFGGEEILPHIKLSTAEAIEAYTYKKAQHYRSEAFLIPQLAEEYGVILNNHIYLTLLGGGQRGDYDTTGLGRASTELGTIINGRASPRSLFRLETPYSELPDTAGLAANKYAGEAGKLFLGMLHDALHPYTAQPGDDYIALTPRKPDDAYRTRRFNGLLANNIARLCSNSETYFAETINHGKLRDVQIDGETVALQKSKGDHTALLAKPAILNGVRLPVGSIVVLETDKAGNHKFAFGRLSAFCFAEPQAGRREFASVFDEEKSALDNPLFANYNQALARFNDYAGRQAHGGTDEIIREYSQSKGQTRTQVVEELAAEVEKAIGADRAARQLRATDREATAVAEAAVRDQQAFVAAQYLPWADPHERDVGIRRLYVKRMATARTFGQEAVERGRTLLDFRQFLEAVT